LADELCMDPLQFEVKEEELDENDETGETERDFEVDIVSAEEEGNKENENG
jgi:hypothetical protein